MTQQDDVVRGQGEAQLSLLRGVLTNAHPLVAFNCGQTLIDDLIAMSDPWPDHVLKWENRKIESAFKLLCGTQPSL